MHNGKYAFLTMMFITLILVGCDKSNEAKMIDASKKIINNVGAWVSYTEDEFGNESLEFFSDETCSIEVTMEGLEGVTWRKFKKRLGCQWTILEDGRIKLVINMTPAEIVAFATVDNDRLFMDEGDKKTMWVRANSNDAKNFETAIALDYSKFFLTLVTEQCIQNITDLGGLKSKLRKDKSFRPAPDLEDIFETHYKNVSFAVTPKAEDCVVDTMLKNVHHDTLFQIHNIDEILKSISERADNSFIEDTGTGPDGAEVKILKKEYQVKDGINLKLKYPVSGQDKYYMNVTVIPADAPNN